MSPKEIAAIITAAARATLVQVAGIPPTELDAICRAIGANAAQALVNADEE